MSAAAGLAGMAMNTGPLTRALAVLAVLLVAGCGGLRSDAEPERIYVLNPAQAAAQVAPAAPPAGGLLMVSRPAVHPGLDTPRIALKRADNELDYYALSRWSGTLPQVLGAFAVQSLQGAFTTVTGSDRGVGPADFDLLLTVRHFEAVSPQDGGTPEIHVAFQCLLMATSPRRVLGSCDAQAREQAEGNRMAAIVAAFERATQRAMADVRNQVIAAAPLAAAQRQR